MNITELKRNEKTFVILHISFLYFPILINKSMYIACALLIFYNVFYIHKAHIIEMN